MTERKDIDEKILKILDETTELCKLAEEAGIVRDYGKCVINVLDTLLKEEEKE